MKINIDVVTSTGGSPITSYSLEMDDGLGGNFAPVFGDVVDSFATTYRFTSSDIRGRTFRARYRVKNAVGWSDYSPYGYILAADVPDAPGTPIITSATSTQITVSIVASEDNGGSLVTAYELYRDDGNSGSFTQVAAYDGMSTSYVFD